MSARVCSSDPARRVWLLGPTVAPAILTPGQPLTYPNIKVVALDSRSTLKLTTLSVTKPASLSTVSVVTGKLVTLP